MPDDTFAAGVLWAAAEIDKELAPLTRAVKSASNNEERRAALAQGVDVLTRLKRGLVAEARRRTG